MKARGFFAVVCVLLLPCARLAHADVAVVPNAQATMEGNDNNFGPFFDNSVRYQQVYSASQFPTGPVTITGIAFRPDGSVTDSSLIIRFDSVRFDLSTTSSTPGTLSTQFANNVGPDDSTVFNSFVFVHAPVTGPPGGPKDFTVTFALSPFIYNPSAGNLLLDVRAFESGGGISAPFDAESNSPFTAHVDAPSIGATTGSVFATGLVTEFQVTPVPEPSTLVLDLLSALLIGMGVWWRQRRSVRG
ncbi:MAG TPA: PEP-CTERM sorting domain-containing protein [Bryobacteraceae bacterium]|jgi:hypothetical protein